MSAVGSSRCTNADKTEGARPEDSTLICSILEGEWSFSQEAIDAGFASLFDVIGEPGPCYHNGTEWVMLPVFTGANELEGRIALLEAHASTLDAVLSKDQAYYDALLGG